MYTFLKMVIILYLKDASKPKFQTPLKPIPQKMHKLLHRFLIS